MKNTKGWRKKETDDKLSAIEQARITEIGRAKSDKEINRKLEELELKAKLAYKKSIDTIGCVSSEIVKNAVTGKTQAKETLLALFDEHNEQYAKRIGVDRVRKSHVRYKTTRKHIYNFLQYKYDVEDISLRLLDMQFINDFHFYLSTVLRLKTNIVIADCTNGATLVGCNVLPDYHGLNMIMALAFRIQSLEAKLFREWVIQQCIVNERQPIVLQYNCRSISTSEQN